MKQRGPDSMRAAASTLLAQIACAEGIALMPWAQHSLKSLTQSCSHMRKGQGTRGWLRTGVSAGFEAASRRSTQSLRCLLALRANPHRSILRCNVMAGCYGGHLMYPSTNEDFTCLNRVARIDASLLK